MFIEIVSFYLKAIKISKLIKLKKKRGVADFIEYFKNKLKRRHEYFCCFFFASFGEKRPVESVIEHDELPLVRIDDEIAEILFDYSVIRVDFSVCFVLF